MTFDPRTKLILSFYYSILVLFSYEPLPLVSEWVFILLLILMTGKTKESLRWFKTVAPMAVFFSAVVWWSADVNSAFIAGFKLINIASVFFAFFISTSPEDLGNALVKAGIPYPVAFVMSVSLQFVPVMARKAGNVIDAQRSRGIPIGPGLKAVRYIHVLLIPVLIQSIRLAEELAEAMESRGFGRSGRTFLNEYKMRPADWIAVFAGMLLLATFLFLQRYI
ncbi:MAG: energy-coupling factor transporter transmembrane protein EcfT [Desulfobacteraceae bacterium]|nr:MAG: energy-coupling factor transporter transmembrane protein EcfT [Desulfobacteraceae bacterium]